MLWALLSLSRIFNWDGVPGISVGRASVASLPQFLKVIRKERYSCPHNLGPTRPEIFPPVDPAAGTIAVLDIR